jgi:four helix bundle protein
MVIRRYQDLITWQLAEAFGVEVRQIVLGSDSARGDFRYRSQILEAADSVAINIAEGFLRCSPGDFARFLGYAIGSLGEAERRLWSGIGRQYFTEERCAVAFRFAKRCMKAAVNLKLSQIREMERRAQQKKVGKHQVPRT